MNSDQSCHTVQLDLAELETFAGLLALYVCPGDVISLAGDLGAGKTTTARVLIRALMDDPDLEVPSPTFSIVQTYRAGAVTVSHFDLYRLSGSDEAVELGFEESRADGITLVEWAERARDVLPKDFIEISIAETSDDQVRSFTVCGFGAWRARAFRVGLIMDFLKGHGWGAVRVSHLQGDASSRRYMRVGDQERRAILMDSPRRPDGPPIRDGLPYSRIAHLAEDIVPFVAVSHELGRIGLSRPEIFAFDAEKGLMLIEDLGDRVFGAEIARGADQRRLWHCAVDVLLALRSENSVNVLSVGDEQTYSVPAFDEGVVLIETELLLDWYWPAVHGAGADAVTRSQFTRLWSEAFRLVSDENPVLVLRDFHSPNLLWLPQREGVQRVGLIDFQDALMGHAAYDLVSLLQDARLDVDSALERELLSYYCDEAEKRFAKFERTDFETAYRILGAQRNTKILGIFARLALRDGKRAYLEHIARIWGYLEHDLTHPGLAALRDWFDTNLPRALRKAPVIGEGGAGSSL